MTITIAGTSYLIIIDGRRTRHYVVDRGLGRWTVTNSGSVLSDMSDIDEGFRSELRLKPGQKWAWEYESLPSWREDAFLNRTRFPSIKAALEAFEEWFKFAQPWEIARVFED